MSNTLNVSSTNNTFLPSGMYEADWSMALALSASLVNLIFVTPLAYSIIWFERFGSDLRRTLLNQIAASICWSIIFQNLINLPVEIYLTVFGPLSPIFCSIHTVLKYSCMLHIVAMLFFMTLVKYMSVFILQNPTGIESEIWCFIINLTTVPLSILSQVAFILMPGSELIKFYICTGLGPIDKEHMVAKKNYAILIAVAITTVFYTFALIKMKIFNNKISAQQQTMPKTNSAPIQQDALANLGSIALILGQCFVISVAYDIINNTSSEQLECKLYLLLIQFYHHGLPLILNLSITIVFFLKSKLLRNAIQQTFSNLRTCNTTTTIVSLE